jgi:hypothetical protein
MIFSDPIAKLSFAMIENYYMLIRLWIQDTLAANTFKIAIEKHAQFRSNDKHRHYTPLFVVYYFIQKPIEFKAYCKYIQTSFLLHDHLYKVFQKIGRCPGLKINKYLRERSLELYEIS